MQRYLIAILFLSLLFAGCGADDATTGIDTSLQAPKNLAATRTGLTKVELRWDENNNGEDGYFVERKSNAGSFRSVIFTVKDVNVVTDSVGLYPDTLYQYRVHAVSVTEYGDFLDTVSIRFTLPYPSVR